MNWTEKYAPKNLEEFIGNAKAIQELVTLIQNKTKAIIVTGPTGSGKTSAAYLIAKHLNYEILELNASDIRGKESLTNSIGEASKQMSLFNKGKIILADELDTIGSDRGSVSKA